MKCFYCDTELDQSLRNEIVFIPLDRPYGNLPVHKGECQRLAEENDYQFLKDNVEKVYLYMGKSSESKSKNTKRK